MAEHAASPQLRPLAAWARGLLRFVGAWLVASIVAAASLLLIDVLQELATSRTIPEPRPLLWSDFGALATFTALTALLSAPVWPVLVFLARRLRAPRGWADAVLGGAVGAAGLAFITRLGAGLPALVYVVLAGAAGGLAFWLAAGRPRPPYRHLLLPGRAPAVVST